MRVTVTVRGSGKTIAARKTVAQTKAGQSAEVDIPLGQTPPIGTRERERRRRGRPGRAEDRQQPPDLHGDLHALRLRSPGAAARARRARRPLVAVCPLAPAGGLSFRAVDELTTTTGIAALAAGALALDRAAVRRRARAAGLRSCARRSASSSASATRRDLVGHAAELERDFRSLHSYVEDARRPAGGPAGDRRAAPRRRDRLPRADPLRRLQRDVGPPVDLDRAARRRGSGVVVSSIHHRDQARLYAKQVVEGAASSSSRPRSRRRCGSRSPARCPARRAAR